MSSEQGKDQKSPKRDHGPQGTHVFSRGEVDQLLQDAVTADDTFLHAQLKGISVEVKGRVFPLSSDRVVIGRDSSCGIILSDSSVSSEHARLNHDANGWRVANLLSTNGTFVNDKRISNEEIHHGDRVRFGRVEFLFQNAEEKSMPADAGQAKKPWWRRLMPWLK